MQTALLTIPELLERDAAIGRLLDQAPSKDLAEARELLRRRKQIRRELEARRVAASN